MKGGSIRWKGERERRDEEREREGKDGKVWHKLNNVQREVMNVQRVGGGWIEGQSHREGGRLVGHYTQSLLSCTTSSGLWCLFRRRMGG